MRWVGVKILSLCRLIQKSGDLMPEKTRSNFLCSKVFLSSTKCRMR